MFMVLISQQAHKSHGNGQPPLISDLVKTAAQISPKNDNQPTTADLLIVHSGAKK